jgi:hypothetical protein
MDYQKAKEDLILKRAELSEARRVLAENARHEAHLARLERERAAREETDNARAKRRAEAETARKAANEVRSAKAVERLKKNLTEVAQKAAAAEARTTARKKREAIIVSLKRNNARFWMLKNYDKQISVGLGSDIVAIQIRAYKVGWTAHELIASTLEFKRKMAADRAVVEAAYGVPAADPDNDAEDAREAALEADMEYSNAAMDAEEAAAGK